MMTSVRRTVWEIDFSLFGVFQKSFFLKNFKKKKKALKKKKKRANDGVSPNSLDAGN